MKNLDILKVKNANEMKNQKQFKDLHENLLRPPFLLVVNGNVRTGKSNLMMNLIYNQSFYKDYFDSIFFVSPTVMNDETLQHLREDDDIVKLSENLENIDEIVKTIVESKQENDNDDKDSSEETEKKHWLLVLDDCLGFIKQRSYISFLCTRYRHYKISIIISSQNFRSIPNVIRQNSSGYLIFKTTNNKEYNKIEDEMGGLLPDFEKLYEIATDKPYNFLFIDLRHIRAYHNFKDLLYSKNVK